MTQVTLVYPYFQPFNDNSIFRFPPLGLGYIAAYLKKQGVPVQLVDCTFLSEAEALERIRLSRPDIVGIQIMFSMKEKAIRMANLLRKDCNFLVAGGPLPTSNPEDFLRSFDAVVIGEGEQTMLELVDAFRNDRKRLLKSIRGVALMDEGRTLLSPGRGLFEDLDSLPFPPRQLFDNQAYKKYYLRRFGYTTTSVITSRGCPFHCHFCSRPVFGNRFRSRSATSVADEVEAVAALGYDRVWFADDCFTLKRKRLIDICDELISRGADIGWECLSRVDTIDLEAAEKMRKAGCLRVFLGIESGNDSVLKIMRKQTTTRQAKEAVHIFKKAGIQTGAFFILGYPGENDRTIIDSVNFASSLPLDYVSFTFPYPIPGTQLFRDLRDRISSDEWEESYGFHVIKHKLLFRSSFSETKLKFAVFKGMTQFYIRKYLGKTGYNLIGRPYERLTNTVCKMLN
jgi:anaerobic magnesium-protoporphyrin IX monomethyl ester cyclase